MQQYQSLKRLLSFYALTLLVMLVLYYSMMLLTLKSHSQEYSQIIFQALIHELTETGIPTDDDINAILERPFFQDISYQLVMVMPSGQTAVYRHVRDDDHDFATVSFPTLASQPKDVVSAYNVSNHYLIGHLNLPNGQQMYAIMNHRPVSINWTAYQSWTPLMAAIILFVIATLYLLKRREDWQKLLHYAEAITTTEKDNYVPTPFEESGNASEFLRLGHSLGRISYQLHSKQRRIKNLNHRLERLVDRSPLPMLMITRLGQISFFNQRFEHVFATTIQRNTNYTLTDFVTGSDKIAQQQLQKLDAQRVVRTLLVAGIEDKQTYQLHITPWFGEHGQVHGFTVIFSNVQKLITETRQMQQQNQQLNQQLSEMMRLKSVMGHELRTPLNAIIGTLDLIEVEGLSDKEKEIMTILTESSQFMLTMLNDMLDMAKIEAGKVDIVSEPIDVFDTSRQATDLMIGNARRQGIELLYFFTPDCPRYICTDSNRLRQILLNLIDNAIKFTRQGYVALIVSTLDNTQMQQVIASDQTAAIESDHQKWLNKTIRAHQTWLHFEVQDTGIGIDQAEQSQLFAYFNQANTRIGRQFGGTGLGLAISNSFAQLLGGFMRLDSKAEAGSTFHLYLPCEAPTYQPVYHSHTDFSRLHLIAIVSQSISRQYLQALCTHLHINASIYTDFDADAQHEIVSKLESSSGQPRPILLLDYEYYISHSARHLITSPQDCDQPILPSTTTTHDLDALLQSAALPKILLSMKPERGIPSTLLQQFDSFLTKPLDITLLLSELARLTTLGTTPLNTKPAQAAEAVVNNDADKQKDSPAATDSQNPLSEAAPSKLVLVVEDNLTNQKITCKLLSKLGYRSTVAEDGRQALNVLSEQRADIALILMDCRMPVMDGLEATMAIRHSGDDITIVALTANDSDDDCAACFAAGMDGFLTKPINKAKLQAALQQFITQ